MKNNYSVLSTVYMKDSPKYLRKSIESMLTQTFSTNDYVMVADGPLTNELNDILSEYAMHYEFFHVYRLEKNSGLGAALNFGLSKCVNELVARMDSDDISLPQRCEKQVELFETNEELAIIGTSMYEISDDEDEILSSKIMPVTNEEILKYSRRRNPFNHSSVMYKRSVILSAGGYNELSRGQDIELFTRLVFEGIPARNISEPLIKYRTNDSQIARRTSWVSSKTIIKVIKRNYKAGYCGLNDLIYVTCAQIGGLVMPKSVSKLLFNKLFRAGGVKNKVIHMLFQGLSVETSKMGGAAYV